MVQKQDENILVWPALGNKKINAKEKFLFFYYSSRVSAVKFFVSLNSSNLRSIPNSMS